MAEFDIAEEREWWGTNFAHPKRFAKANAYLDEMARLSAENERLRVGNDRLRAQLADQRASAIRFAALSASTFGEGVDSATARLRWFAECYDRLDAIEVPPPKGGARG